MSVFIARDTLKRIMAEKRISFRKLAELSNGTLTKGKLLNRSLRRKDRSVRLSDTEAEVLQKITEHEFAIPFRSLLTPECREDFELGSDALELQASLFSERPESYDVGYLKGMSLALKEEGFVKLLDQAKILYTIITQEQDVPDDTAKVSESLKFITEACAPNGRTYSADFRLSSGYSQAFFDKLQHVPEERHADRALCFYAYALGLTYSLFYRVLLVSVAMFNPYRTSKATKEYSITAMTLEKIVRAFFDYVVYHDCQVEDQEDFELTGREYEVTQNAQLLIVACDAVVRHCNSDHMASQYINSKEMEALVERQRRLLTNLGLPSIAIPDSGDYLGTDFGREALVFKATMKEHRLNEKLIEKKIASEEMAQQIMRIEIMKNTFRQ